MAGLRQLAIEIFLIIAIGAVLGLLGPFGSYAMPIAPRLVYWIGFILVGYVIFRPVQTVAVWLAEQSPIPLNAALGVSTGLASLPLAALIGFALGGMDWGSPYLSEGFATLYLQVAALGLAILFGMRLLFGADRVPLSDAATAPPMPLSASELPEPPSPTAPFFERLPREIGRNLVCLEMQDHYVKVHALSGSAMILMRLRDAIAEMDGIEGLQVHRSWWVVRSEVRAVRREARAMKLELSNGLLAPVARNRQADLKRDGWI